MMNILNSFVSFANYALGNKSVIFQLAKRDYKNKYVGSFFGFAWTVVQPIVMIAILWIVFSVGFKVKEVNGAPFVAWLTVAIVAWNFFSDTLLTVTNVFSEYSYLVKKVHFRFALLPIVKLLSSLMTHLIFLVIAMFILLLSGIEITFYWIQALYYLVAMMVLLLGVSWITSCLQVFVKDVYQVVSIILQFGFWLTPVFWNIGLLPDNLHNIIRLNPMFYIVEGYRKSFIYGQPFWHDYTLGLYYWGFTLVLLIIGITLFKRLSPHFADVL